MRSIQLTSAATESHVDQLSEQRHVRGEHRIEYGIDGDAIRKIAARMRRRREYLQLPNGHVRLNNGLRPQIALSFSYNTKFSCLPLARSVIGEAGSGRMVALSGPRWPR